MLDCGSSLPFLGCSALILEPGLLGQRLAYLGLPCPGAWTGRAHCPLACALGSGDFLRYLWAPRPCCPVGRT